MSDGSDEYLYEANHPRARRRRIIFWALYASLFVLAGVVGRGNAEAGGAVFLGFATVWIVQRWVWRSPAIFVRYVLEQEEIVVSRVDHKLQPLKGSNIDLTDLVATQVIRLPSKRGYDSNTIEISPR